MLSASKRRLSIMLLCLAAATGQCVSQSLADDGLSQAHDQYPPTLGYAEIFAGLDRATASAAAQEKLLMVVLGANWCHDSRAFVDRMAEPEFAALLDQRYVVERVNIGYFDHVRGVVERYGVPVIYGTPTVLVIEPVSLRVLNEETLPYWRNADSIGLEETLTYFSGFEPGQAYAPEAGPPPAALAQALARIDAFERAQAERIYRAFAELGPLLRTYEAEGEAPGFMDQWQSLATLRGRITEDLPALRASARAQFARGEAIVLAFPEYPLFID